MVKAFRMGERSPKSAKLGKLMSSGPMGPKKRADYAPPGRETTRVIRAVQGKQATKIGSSTHTRWDGSRNPITLPIIVGTKPTREIYGAAWSRSSSDSEKAAIHSSAGQNFAVYKFAVFLGFCGLSAEFYFGSVPHCGASYWLIQTMPNRGK